MDIAAGTRLGPYRILSAIGAGGQGEVYKAVDTTLNRAVVIKVLPHEQALKPSLLARFEREAKLASALDHPNICTIHGLHEVDGVLFIAMQYIEGQTVRQLVNGTPLELTGALAVAIQVADALAAAHARGIIHRDIKAGNVVVTQSGIAKVLDFGLAKLLEDEGQDTNDPHLTELGQPYGTATYAAPEQASGGLTDHRADIFSTGVLLYELLAGTWPFKGKTAVDVRYAVIHATPRPLSEARGEDSPVLVRLQEIVDRCLAKEPADRFQQVTELRDALRAVLREVDPETHFSGSAAPVAPRRDTRAGRMAFLRRYQKVILIVACVSAVALAVYFLLGRSCHAAIDSLAVLPFMNATADPNTDYLSDGITESLINSLSQLPSVKVRSRNSVFHYKGQQTDVEKIGRDLGVRSVVAGRVEQRGDSLSISVELIDIQDDSQIWGEHYTRKLSDLISLQEELSRDITDKLRLRLTGAEQQQLVKNYGTNSEAYQLYLQGRYYWNKRTAEGLQKGLEYFTRAIERDPNYALAYSGLADCYLLLNVYDIKPSPEANPKAREAAAKALALDEKLAEAHASLADVSYRYDWKWAEAEQHFKRAIELNTGYATAHQWYSALLAARGRFDEANTEARRARELEPFSLIINTVVGRRLYYARQFEQAAMAYRKTIEMDRTFVRAHVELGDTLAQLSRGDEAQKEFQQALLLDKESVSALVGLGHAYAVGGQKQAALQVIEELRRLAQRRYVSPYHFAVIYAGLGDHAKALDYLEKAAAERFNWVVFLRVEPLFDSLRSEPRFAALVERIGLA